MGGCGEVGSGESLFNGFRVSVGEEEKVLAMEPQSSGDGCTTTGMYVLIATDCTPNNDESDGCLHVCCYHKKGGFQGQGNPEAIKPAGFIWFP